MSDEEYEKIGNEDLTSLFKEINMLKKQHDSLLREQRMLSEGRDSNIKFTQEFKQRAVKLKKNLDEEEKKSEDAVKKEQEKLEGIKQENRKLKEEIWSMEQKLRTMDEDNKSLRQQTEVSTAVPEKKVVFNGDVANGAHALSFDMKPRIVFPMEGGTALITFEEEEVAEKILALREHVVALGDCSIAVQAEPVRFLVPVGVEMDTQVCPQRILVSDLPKKMSVEKILDKLEIHFSKGRNGGGEVEDIDMLEDSGNVVVAFVDSTIAKGLTDKQIHEVEIEKGKKHKVKVTPFLNGSITLLKVSEHPGAAWISFHPLPHRIGPILVGIVGLGYMAPQTERYIKNRGLSEITDKIAVHLIKETNKYSTFLVKFG
uniref:Interferon-induced protein 35 n=1 Tax=Astyanax mexicanus TaxID=7994 RepID=A0A3B1K378_ASTMX